MLYLGLLALWVLATASGAWPWPVTAGLGVIVTALVVWAAQRLRVADREAAAPFTLAPRTLGLLLANAPRRWRDALGVFAAALGARERTPVFVRLKLRPADPLAAASVISAMSGAPGIVVVDGDAGSLLAHALSEDDVEIGALQALERAALGGAGR